MSNYRHSEKQRIEEGDWYATPDETLVELKQIADKYLTETDIVIDAGAADGRIMDALQHKGKCIGIDVNPRREDIIKGNFLEWRPPNNKESYVLVSNPPFKIAEARNAPKKFVEHALTFCRLAICIIPLNFRKETYVHQLAQLNIKMIEDKIMPVQFYDTERGKKKVLCAIAVYRKMTPQEMREYENEKTLLYPFVVPFTSKEKFLQRVNMEEPILPDLLIKCMASIKDIGRVFVRGTDEYNEELEKLRTSKGVSMYCFWVNVRKNGNFTEVAKEMFDSGFYLKTLDKTCAGNMHTMTVGDLCSYYLKYTGIEEEKKKKRKTQTSLENFFKKSKE